MCNRGVGVRKAAVEPVMPSVEVGKRSVEVGKPGVVVAGQGVRGNESFLVKERKTLTL